MDRGKEIMLCTCTVGMYILRSKGIDWLSKLSVPSALLLYDGTKSASLAECGPSELLSA